MTVPPSVGEPEVIRLTLPALAPYARIARLAVTGLASRMGFSYDEIEDLRIALGEVFGVLVDDHAGSRLTFTCTLDGPTMVVEATREPASPAPAVGDLTRQILDAVVDEADIDPDRARIRVVKSQPA